MAIVHITSQHSRGGSVGSELAAAQALVTVSSLDGRYHVFFLPRVAVSGLRSTGMYVRIHTYGLLRTSVCPCLYAHVLHLPQLPTKNDSFLFFCLHKSIPRTCSPAEFCQHTERRRYLAKAHAVVSIQKSDVGRRSYHTPQTVCQSHGPFGALLSPTLSSKWPIGPNPRAFSSCFWERALLLS